LRSCYSEDPGCDQPTQIGFDGVTCGDNSDTSVRPRAHWTKKITQTTPGVTVDAANPTTGETGHFSYDLYHTVHTGWGYVYILELCGGVDGNQCTSFYG